MSQRKAYREAFAASGRWKDATVDNKASKLFKEDEILARYRELQEQAQDEAIMTRKERMVRLSEIVEENSKYPDTQIKAIDTLNKMDGVYTNKVEMTGNVGLGVVDKKQLAKDFLNELVSDE